MKIFRSGKRQSGITTTFIAILLLVILSLGVLMAVSTGLFEQRTAANEQRQKIAHHAAEAGLAVGIEFMNANYGDIASTDTGGWMAAATSTRWVICDAADTTFPCGSEPDSTKRATMYRYVGDPDAVDVELPISDLDDDLLGGTTISSEFSVSALLCPFDPDAPSTCTAPSADADQFAVTIVSRGSVTADNAFVQIKQTLSTFQSSLGGPDAPLIAAGSVGGAGSANIAVASTDAGPISIWSGADANWASGTPTTCEYTDMVDANSGSVDTTSHPGYTLCDSCSCPSSAAISGKVAGGTWTEGKDVLDNDGDIGYTPDAAFPADLFAYMFGVPEANFQQIKDLAEQVANCDSLDDSSSGLYWVTNAQCYVAGGRTIGSPENPVIIVVEEGGVPAGGSCSPTPSTQGSAICIKGGSIVYGAMFIFDRNSDGAIGEVEMAGNSTIYGSIVSDAQIDFGAGTFTIIYSDDIMANINTQPAGNRLGAVPGSWTDRVSN